MSSIEGIFNEYSMCSEIDVNRYSQKNENLDFVMKTYKKFIKLYQIAQTKEDKKKYKEYLQYIKLIYSYDKPLLLKLQKGGATSTSEIKGGGWGVNFDKITQDSTPKDLQRLDEQIDKQKQVIYETQNELLQKKAEYEKKMDETLSLVLSKEDNKIIKNKIQNVVNTYNVLTDTIKKDET